MGYTYGFFLIGPDDALAEDALIAQMRERSYDGVEFFDYALNAVKDTLLTAQLLFNSSPPPALNAVRRNFPL